MERADLLLRADCPEDMGKRHIRLRRRAVAVHKSILQEGLYCCLRVVTLVICQLFKLKNGILM